MMKLDTGLSDYQSSILAIELSSEKNYIKHLQR